MPEHPAVPELSATTRPTTPTGADALLFALTASPAPIAIADPRTPGTPVVWATAAFAEALGLPDALGRPLATLPVFAEPAPGEAGGPNLVLLRPVTTDDDLARSALTLLERMGAALSSSLDVHEVLRHVVDTAVPALADWCAVDLVEGDEPPSPGAARPPDAPDVVNEIERRLVRAAVAHRDPDKEHLLLRVAEIHALRPNRSVAPGALLPAEPQLIEDLNPHLIAERAAGDPELAEILTVLDDRAGAVMPLVARGRGIGAITLSVNGRSRRPFGRREFAIAEVLAARVALTVDNALLFAAETAERHRAAALAEAGTALGGTLRTREVLDVLLGIVVPQHADWSFVMVDPTFDRPEPRVGASPDSVTQPLVLAATRHRDPRGQAETEAFLSRHPLRRGNAGPSRAWTTGRTQLVRVLDDEYRAALAGDDLELARFVRQAPVTTSVHVPLVAGGRVLGTWSVLRGEGEPYSEADARFLTELGRRAAQALLNARTFEAEQVVALELQRSLLPAQLPQVPGLQAAGRYLPGSGALVGGDWYDVLPLSGGRVGLSVGDVMGRGVRAAAVMGQLRAAVRSYAAEGLAPRDVLGRLTAFARLLEGEEFATCLYAVHDPDSGVTTVASAGHLPPLLVPAGSGEVHVVDVRPGVPLGVEDPGSTYAECTVRLGLGDSLVLFTDGLVEDRRTSFADGIHRLGEGLAATRPGNAEAVCAQALRVMGREQPHDDDTAVLAVRAVPVTADLTSPDERSTRLRLAAQPRSAATARRHVIGTLGRWGAEDVAETAALLVSELVTNALRHGHGPIDLELSGDPRGCLVRVGDTSPALPPDPGTLGWPEVSGLVAGGDALDVSESGRGLLLVEALADEWGWRPRADGGKDVWFRLPYQPAAG